MDYRLEILKERIEAIEERIYLDKLELNFIRNELIKWILAACLKTDGMILNEISEEYNKLGINIDHRTIYKNNIIPLVKKGTIEEVNPEAKRNKKYRLKTK